MRFIEIFRRLSIATLASCVALPLSIGTAAAAETAGPPGNSESGREPVEEIEVTGRRLLRLRTEIVGIENRMFDIFNAVNDTPAFKIHCVEGIVTGSRIPERECVPTYMKQARMSENEKFLFYDLLSVKVPGAPGGVSMNTKGAPGVTEEQLWFHNNHRHVAFNTHFRELAARHPELRAVALELQAKRQELLDSEARLRKESAVGRIFSAFGDREKE